MERPTKEQIMDLPIFQGVSLDNIKVIINKSDALSAIDKLIKYPVLGFDTESKPTFRKGEKGSVPEIIQISCKSETFIFPTRFPSTLEVVSQILNNKNIKKVGFGLKDDKSRIFKRYGIKVVNTVELSTKVQSYTGVKQRVGARVAVAMLFKQRLTKSAQKSNWSLFPLEDYQLRYAANDAYAALCIESEIEKENLENTL